MFRSIPLPIQLIAIIAFVIIAGSFVPIPLAQGTLTFSLCFKELLGFFLPFMVFAFVFSGITSFKKKAPLVLSIMISMITISNALVATIAYGVIRLLLPYLVASSGTSLLAQSGQLEPYFSITIPFGFSSEKALLAAIVTGLLLSCIEIKPLENFLHRFKSIIETILIKFFIPLLPLYVLGFLLKIHHEGVFGQLFSNYGKAFGLIIIIQIIYLTWMYLVASNFNIKRTIETISNAMPSYLTAFSTMSSTATIPVSIEGAIKNTHNTPLAHLAMPIMANVHLLGDCISTPVLALMTHWIFLGSLPLASEYGLFVCYFAITMLAASGVPGGGIIVMIPILKSLLHFNAEMVSIIMTLYLLQDPLGTAGNVMGDGALVIMVNKVLQRLRIIS